MVSAVFGVWVLVLRLFLSGLSSGSDSGSCMLAYESARGPESSV